MHRQRLLTSAVLSCRPPAEVAVVHRRGRRHRRRRVPPPPAATAAAEAAFRLRTRFVDDQRAAFHLLLVELADGFLRFLVRAHLDEREAARAAGGHVPHHANVVHLAGPAEQFRELIFRGRIGKVPDVESPAHAVTYSC